MKRNENLDRLDTAEIEYVVTAIETRTQIYHIAANKEISSEDLELIVQGDDSVDGLVECEEDAEPIIETEYESERVS